MDKRRITGGLYLVVDPSIEDVLVKVDEALKGGVDVIQVWNKHDGVFNQVSFINAMCCLADAYQVPVLVHNDVQLLMNTEAHGIHFDELPDELDVLRRQIKRPVIVGVTCGNNHQEIARAIDAPVDYLSFCSMYPSPNGGDCELVMPQVVRQTRRYTSLPIFLAGGVTPENTNSLMTLGGDGIAIVSGILKAKDCCRAAREFKDQLNIFKTQPLS
jgi:thiamine-phosphate pyrophosphorylase